MDVTGDLEVPRHSDEATPTGEQTTGNSGSNGVAASDADSGGDTGMVPRHVVDELRKKKRELESRVEQAEQRSREWADDYRRSTQQARAAQPAAPSKPDILDDPDLDEDERRFIQLERNAAMANEEAKSATNLVRKMEMEAEVRRYVSEANSRASEQGIPISIDEGDIYARIVGNIDGRFGRDVREVVKNFYNKEFEKVESIRESEQKRSREAAEAGSRAGESGGKLPTPTPPTPVDFSEVPHKDIWQKAEEATVEALQRMKRG